MSFQVFKHDVYLLITNPGMQEVLFINLHLHARAFKSCHQMIPMCTIDGKSRQQEKRQFRHTKAVFECIRKVGFKLQKVKCHFVWQQLNVCVQEKHRMVPCYSLKKSYNFAEKAIPVVFQRFWKLAKYYEKYPSLLFEKLL